MHQISFKSNQKIPKTYAKAIQKAEAELDQEMAKQTNLVYAAGMLALRREFNWSDDEILNYYHEQEDVYDECGATIGKSMIQMCSDEVGIDMAIEETNTPWEEIEYLNPEFGLRQMTMQEYLYMRLQQKKWVRAQYLACFMLTAKRKHDFKEEELGKLFVGIMDVLREYEGNIKLLVQQCKEELGFTITREDIIERRNNGNNLK